MIIFPKRKKKENPESERAVEAVEGAAQGTGADAAAAGGDVQCWSAIYW